MLVYNAGLRALQELSEYAEEDFLERDRECRVPSVERRDVRRAAKQAKVDEQQNKLQAKQTALDAKLRKTALKEQALQAEREEVAAKIAVAAAGQKQTIKMPQAGKDKKMDTILWQQAAMWEERKGAEYQSWRLRALENAKKHPDLPNAKLLIAKAKADEVEAFKKTGT